MRAIATISLLLLSGNLAAAEQSEPENPDIERSQLFAQVGAAGTLSIENPFGDVRARFGGYEPRAEILATTQNLRADGVLLEVASKETEEGAEVAVGYPAGALPAPEGDRSRVDVVVFVPEGVTLEVETKGGLVEAKGLKGDVSIVTETGEVRVKGTTGVVHARTDSGNMNLTFDPALEGPPHRLESVRGDILVFLPETASAVIVAETSAEICTDFSIEIEHRRTEEPSKKAKAEIGENGRTYLLRTLRGRIGLYRLQKVFEHAGESEKGR